MTTVSIIDEWGTAPRTKWWRVAIMDDGPSVSWYISKYSHGFNSTTDPLYAHSFDTWEAADAMARWISSDHGFQVQIMPVMS